MTSLESPPPAQPLPTVRDVLTRITAYLSLKHVDSPRLSAEVLVAHALGAERTDLFAVLERPMSPAEERRALVLAERRGTGEPVAYILGSKEFYGLDLAVTRDTLIPRPETEHLVEAALERFDARSGLRFADLGTGCGALAVALAMHRPRARGLALDLSAGALAVAQRNLAAYGLLDRVLPVQGDFGNLPARARKLDLVLANPPYVSQAEYAKLSPEILDFEPCMAFVPGKECVPRQDHDGLAAARTILPQAAACLAPGGLLLMELGSAQGDEALALARDHMEAGERAWDEVAILRDLAGLDRVLAARRP